MTALLVGVRETRRIGSICHLEAGLDLSTCRPTSPDFDPSRPLPLNHRPATAVLRLDPLAWTAVVETPALAEALLL